MCQKVVIMQQKDFVNLLKGLTPSYEQMAFPMVDNSGSYSGSYGTWTWNHHAFESNTSEELWALYQKLTEGK